MIKKLRNAMRDLIGWQAFMRGGFLADSEVLSGIIHEPEHYDPTGCRMEAVKRATKEVHAAAEALNDEIARAESAGINVKATVYNGDTTRLYGVDYYHEPRAKKRTTVEISTWIGTNYFMEIPNECDK